VFGLYKTEYLAYIKPSIWLI